MNFVIFLCFTGTYTIYVLCQKIYNLFVRALETGRKVSLWWVFLACFRVSGN